MEENVREDQEALAVAPQAGKDQPEFICDRCGTEMITRNCKVICPNCGNRFDCSDLNLYFD